MKPLKKCPNCQSRRIAGPHDDAGRIIAWPVTGIVQTESYACVDCGFIQKFIKHHDIRKMKMKGKFTLNPPNPDITHCPECEAAFKEHKCQCHKCGFERDFSYLDNDDDFEESSTFL